jgi:hypothetical protein
MYASWHTHILPFIEQDNLFRVMQPNVNGQGKPVSIFTPFRPQGAFGYSGNGFTGQQITDYVEAASRDGSSHPASAAASCSGGPGFA